MNFEDKKFRIYLNENNEKKIRMYLEDEKFDYEYRDKNNKSILIYLIEMHNKNIYFKQEGFKKMIEVCIY